MRIREFREDAVIYRPTRRDLLSMAAAMPALTLPVAARAQLGPPPAGNPAHFSFTLGDATLTVISDGHLELPVSGLAVNADRDEVRAFLGSYALSTEQNYSHTNHLLIERGDAKVLVDVGSGDRFLPTAGRLWENMEAAGIDRDSITHVIITHAHPDHIWGVRDGFDEAIVPGAQYFIGRAERNYWMQDGLVDQVPAEMQQFVLGARNSIEVDGADWTLMENDHEVAPGIRVIDTPGHTPGHMSVLVDTGDRPLLALGDAMSHVWTNFVHPEWYNEFDMDGAQTVETRRRLLEMAATEEMAVLGYHFPFPGVGHVKPEGDAYRFIPALWRW
ncbi:MBL fold metallo-hydrolase [Citreimonas salinaria]|uniref:MBL fold metallo-hydrolase n=1 Tax=Citreimonas salinaria TaxID=321339 RepID=UPI000B7EF3FD|nr:MBL fold metallo-hydrolase [Citreimonas salinaria]